MKIAVCISGLLQYWNITNRLFKYWNSIYDDIDFTFFLSTWEENSTFASTDKFYEKKGKVIQNNKFSEDTYDFLEDIEFISPNVIPKEITDIHDHTGPFLSYQMYNVQRMRKRYEEKVGKKFDLVVQTREDLMILKRTLNLFKTFYNSKQIVDGMVFSTSGTEVIVPRGNPKGYSYAIPNDNFFFGHSDAMDKFSEMYNDCYVNKTNKETFGHFMHAQQLIDKGIYNCKLGNRYSTFLIRNHKLEDGITLSSEKLNELLDKKGVEWIYSGDNDDELIQHLRFKKSAILLHGLVGTLQDKNEKHKLINSNVDYDTKKDSNVVLKKGWESYSKNFDDCDYYIHSWNTELEKEITELYKPIKYKLEEQIKFQAPQEHKGSDLRWINHMGRFYSMKQSIEMCLSKNIKYDYIMISRFDLVFKNKFNFIDTECLVSKWYDEEKIDYQNKINDFWFVLNYESLIKFYEELNNIEEYMLRYQTKIGISPHYALSRIFTKLDFKIKENLKYYNNKKQHSDYGLVRETIINKKILIGLGCSHTQGCAIQENGKLLSQQLKDLYNREYVSPEWITENFSWIGHLGNLLNVDEKLNFGFGGKGIEQCIRAIKNYSFWKKDLRNHLIIFQIPSFDRIDVLYKTGNRFALSPSTAILHSSKLKDYVEKYYDNNFYQYKFLNELYFTQDYLEKLGAKVFFIDIFCTIDKDYSKKIFDDNNLQRNWEPNLTKNIGFEKLIKSLNILKLDSNKNKKLTRLAEENLLEDYHLSETGNRNLAELIYEKIKDEKSFT